MEKLQLLANQPQIISLQFTKGMPVTGNFGDQILFTLADGRKWYTTPFVASKVDALNVGKGEPFEICKRETIDGNRRKVEFEVKPLSPSPAVSQATAQRSVTSTQPSGHHSAQVVSQPASQSTSTSTMTADTNLDLALRYAIDSASAAEQYAKTMDYALRFTSEDIRCMALSKFIAMDRSNGGGKWSN